MNSRINSVPPTAGSFRAQRIKYAALTSIGSKITTLIVQTVALPVAARALGVEQFALYVMLAATIGWLSIVNIGLGPVLTINTATALAKQDYRSVQKWFVSAFYPTLLFAALVGFITLFIIAGTSLPIDSVFGPAYVEQSRLIKQAVLILVSFVLLRSVFSIMEAAQIGYQEQHIVNLRSMVGSLVSIVALAIVAYTSPSVVGLILAVNVPLFAFQGANAGWFLRKNKQLSFRWRDFDRVAFLDMASSGAAFSLAGTLGNYLNHQFSIILVGRVVVATVAATYAGAMQIVVLALGIVTSVAAPMLPAIADSVARNEVNWAKRAYRRLLLLAVSYACISALVIAFVGRPILTLLYTSDVVQPTTSLMILTGIYFALDVWEHVHFMVLIGLNRIRLPSLIYFGRSVLFVIVAPIAVSKWGAPGALLALSLSLLIFTAVLFPYMVRRTLSKLDNQQPY